MSRSAWPVKIALGGLYLVGAGALGLLFVYGPGSIPSLGHWLYRDLSDQLLNFWIVDRAGENLLHHPSRLFDGRIFYPSPRTLAFSEALLLPSLCYRALLAVAGSKVWAFHALIALGLAANMLAMAQMMRRTVGAPAAWMAALVFGLSMLRVSQMGHPQLLPQLFFPITFAALWDYRRAPGRKQACLIALALAAEYYCSVYLGMMLLISLFPFVVWELYLYPERRRSFTRDVAWAGLLFALLILPYAYVYFWVSDHYHIVRSIQECHANAAHVLNYLLAPPGSWHGAWTVSFQKRIPNLHEKHLFLGLVALGLAAAGIKALVRLQDREACFWKRVLFTTLCLAIWMSLGPQARLYSVFYYFLPGGKGIRVPARFGLAYLFVMAVLAGIGFEAIKRKWPRAVAPIWLAVAVAFLFENHVPATFARLPDDLQKVTAFLSTQPTGAPVAHVPLRFEFDFGQRENVRMFYALYHGHPIVNGYSSFIPEPHFTLGRDEFFKGVSADILGRLRTMGARYVVFEKAFPEEAFRKGWRRVLETLPTKPVYEDELTAVWDLEPL